MVGARAVGFDTMVNDVRDDVLPFGSKKLGDLSASSARCVKVEETRDVDRSKGDRWINPALDMNEVCVGENASDDPRAVDVWKHLVRPGVMDEDRVLNRKGRGGARAVVLWRKAQRVERSGRRGWRGSDARAKRGDSERDWAEMQPGDKGRRLSERQSRAKRRGS
jgi:hypothetical protein